MSDLSDGKGGVEDFYQTIGVDLHGPGQLQVTIDDRGVAGVDENLKVGQRGRRGSAAHNSLDVYHSSLQNDQRIRFNVSRSFGNGEVTMDGIELQKCQVGAARTKDTVKHDVVVTRNDHATAATGGVP